MAMGANSVIRERAAFFLDLAYLHENIEAAEIRQAQVQANEVVGPVFVQGMSERLERLASALGHPAFAIPG